MLAYLPGRSSGASLPKTLAFAGRDGKIQTIGLPPQPYIHPRLSPDGRQLVVGTDDGKDANVWVYDLKSGGSLRRLTFGGRNQYPIWTRDGRFITFQSDRDGDDAIFRQPADGSGPAERLTKPDAGVAHQPESWSPDGKTLSMNVVARRQPEHLDDHHGSRGQADGHSRIRRRSKNIRRFRLMADGWRIWPPPKAVQTFTSSRFHRPAPNTRFQHGGRTPVWSPDGKQLFFHATTPNRFVVVDIRAEQGLTFGTPWRCRSKTRFIPSRNATTT